MSSYREVFYSNYSDKEELLEDYAEFKAVLFVQWLVANFHTYILGDQKYWVQNNNQISDTLFMESELYGIFKLNYK